MVLVVIQVFWFFFSSRRRHTRWTGDWSSDVCSSDLDHRRIDAAGGDVVAAPRGDADEALVVTEIEVGLGPVIGDIDLAMLRRAHRARVDVEIGVELAQPDAE